MIYLFDDKSLRQRDYGWDSQKFAKYSEVITPIYSLQELDDNKKREIFSVGNTILFHESFLEDNGIEVRNKLNEYAQNNANFTLIFFSGSKASRVIDLNVGHLPVSILYQNLLLFLDKVKNNEPNIRHLFFGENHGIEEILFNKLKIANNDLEDSIENENPPYKIFIARTKNDFIEKPFQNAIYKTFIPEEKYNYDLTDEYFHDKLNEWFLEDDYDRIFIPLCFGPTLSDFNGLRFATHIRCTNTLNRVKSIFIYSFLDYDSIIKNEFFDILKTKNIYLINYSKTGFQSAVENTIDNLTIDELPNEIRKIRLDPPKNYLDSHSITNEWAIYRWSTAINTSDDRIEEIIENVKTQLYFKYLCTLYPISEIKQIPEVRLTISNPGKPQIIYIDDDADKGWREIFLKIFYDSNKIDFDYLCEQLKLKSQIEIINLVIETIREKEIDLVILDFRLHQNDFDFSIMNEVTGLKLLKEIKKFNPGIQVVMFSATNKIWNLQALQNFGVDGFINKESPENSIDPNFTVMSIENFISVISNCLNKVFLKEFYIKIKDLKDELIPRKNYRKSIKPLPKEFVDEAIKWLELSYELLGKGISNTSLTAAFLFMFSVLENLSNRIINVEEPISIDGQNGKYKFEFRGTSKRLNRFIEDEYGSGFYRRTKTILESNRNLPWIFKILNTLDFITQEKLSEKEISLLVKKRNDIIHANSTTGEIIEIKREMLISLNEIIFNGLINVK